MGLIKFITVFDDENQLVLSETVLKRYNISAYPVVYFSDGKAYYDGLNSDSETFFRLKKIKGVTCPRIPAKVFQSAFLNAYNDGYFKVIVVCPHSKYFPYYKDAVAAATKFRHRKTLDFTTFDISVIDSKTFAAGVHLFTLEIARQYEIYHMHSDALVDYCRSNAIRNKSIILLRGGNIINCRNNELTAFKSFGYKFEELNLSDSHDNVRLDIFADLVCSEIKKGSGRYSVAVGSDCDFAGYVLGQIEKNSGIVPVCVMKYGIVSTDVLGNSAFCVSLLN